jgi:2-polyprenyl-3-methyl-5-hydroxy-6-metoxy-1,4-benzoquinol methylase
LKLDPDALCPLCRDPDAQLKYRLTKLRVYACPSCGLVYLWPRLSESAQREMFSRLYVDGEPPLPELERYYDSAYDDSPSNPLVRRYECWLDALERERSPGRILDIGCGTGLFLAVARRRGWQPHGIDACADVTAFARDHFGLEVWDGDVGDARFAELRFDAITLWDVLEHARDPLTLLQTARRRLSSGGVLGIATPNQRSILDAVAGGMYRLSDSRITRPLEKFYIDQHLLYFDEATLRHALRRAGFAVARLRRELTDLRRLTLSLPARLALYTLFAAARISGLGNRLFAVAHATGSDCAAASTPLHEWPPDAARTMIARRGSARRGGPT